MAPRYPRHDGCRCCVPSGMSGCSVASNRADGADSRLTPSCLRPNPAGFSGDTPASDFGTVFHDWTRCRHAEAGPPTAGWETSRGAGFVLSRFRGRGAQKCSPVKKPARYIGGANTGQSRARLVGIGRSRQEIGQACASLANRPHFVRLRVESSPRAPES